LSGPEHGKGRGNGGSGDTLAVADGFPFGVEEHGLRPEPPTSMERVMGPANLPGIGLANLGFFDFAGLGVIRRELYSGRAELCGENWTEIGGVAEVRSWLRCARVCELAALRAMAS